MLITSHYIKVRKRKMYAVFLLFFLLTSGEVLGQIIKPLYDHLRGNQADSSLVVMPETENYASILILVPSMNESPRNVLSNTEIPIQLARQGMLCVIPSFSFGNNYLGVLDCEQFEFNLLIDFIVGEFNLRQKKFYLGGFSTGGTFVIKYAESTLGNASLIKPNAVFAIDPPLDFERLYYALSRNIDLAKNNLSTAAILKSRIQRDFGGHPKLAPDLYFQKSPYSRSDTTQSAVKKLIHIPIMLFSSADAGWFLQNRRTDVYSMNLFDCSGLIADLRRLGSNDAFLTVAHPSANHQVQTPHSWNIAESVAISTFLSRY